MFTYKSEITGGFFNFITLIVAYRFCIMLTILDYCIVISLIFARALCFSIYFSTFDMCR